jgi:hypothetical protein
MQLRLITIPTERQAVRVKAHRPSNQGGRPVFAGVISVDRLNGSTKYGRRRSDMSQHEAGRSERNARAERVCTGETTGHFVLSMTASQ